MAKNSTRKQRRNFYKNEIIRNPDANVVTIAGTMYKELVHPEVVFDGIGNRYQKVTRQIVKL